MNLPTQISMNDVTGKTFQFTSFEVFSDFIKTELDFWKTKTVKQQEDSLFVHSYLNITSNFQNSLTVIEGWMPNLEIWDSSTFSSQINSLANNYLNTINGQWLWSGHPFIDAWLHSYKYSNGTGDGFLAAIVRKESNNVTNYEYLQGYILAYEYNFQAENKITKRRHTENIAFETIRQQLVTKKEELINEVSNYQDEINRWKKNAVQESEIWLINHNQLVDDTSIKHSKDFQDRISVWTEKVTDLEVLYKEKLRFESSASYWAKSAKKFKDQGFYWGCALVVTAVSAIIYFSNFFISWLQGHKTAIQLSSIEGVILFGAILSSFAILIRTFSKLTFSSFHLQRDAEEREQLTHLYLALGNETEVDSESRKIILQSLFSRSETGLLANESGPTMPSLNDVVSVISKRGT